jgi:FMN-dependent NADH-azoreductase
MKVLHIDSSARFNGSASRDLSGYFIKLLIEQVPDVSIDRLDLAVNPPRHVSELQTAAMYTPEDERTPPMVDALRESEELCNAVLSADAIICGIPMYNFGVPSSFKAFIDNIVRVGKTFVPTDEGYQGMLSKKQILFVTTRGADFQPGSALEGWDHLTPHLKTVFAFMGANDNGRLGEI